MSNAIPDFTDQEKQLVDQTLIERYGHAVTVQYADAEVRLSALNKDLDLCPTLVWLERGATFVIIKTGDNRFRCQFYYTDVEQYGTGIEEYDNLGDCVITVLQVQSDHERDKAGVRTGMNAVDFSKANDGDDYYPPVII